MKKRFHVSDLLSITTGRLVSTRHMDGVYEILNHITGDNLFTHQLPRAAKECDPVLASAFPCVRKDSPTIIEALRILDENLAAKVVEPKDIIGPWLNTLVHGGFGDSIPEWFDVEPWHCAHDVK